MERNQPRSVEPKNDKAQIMNGCKFEGGVKAKGHKANGNETIAWCLDLHNKKCNVLAVD